MNNLHREHAPISDAAWAQIEDEASRTLKRYLAARGVVDVDGPKGVGYAAVGTGHTRPIAAPADSAGARAATTGRSRPPTNRPLIPRSPSPSRWTTTSPPRTRIPL